MCPEEKTKLWDGVCGRESWSSWKGRKIYIQIGSSGKTSPMWWPRSKDLGAWVCLWKDRCKTLRQKRAGLAWVACVAEKRWNGGDQSWHRIPFQRVLLVLLGLWLLVSMRKEVSGGFWAKGVWSDWFLQDCGLCSSPFFLTVPAEKMLHFRQIFLRGY